MSATEMTAQESHARLQLESDRYLNAILDFAEGRTSEFPRSSATVSRRSFIKLTGMATGGFALAFYVGKDNVALADVDLPGFAPNAYLHISKENVITIYAKNPEIGQGVKTALPMIVAEELDADWATVKAVQSAVGPQYGMQMAGGSRSVPSNWEVLRKAGATARAMLVAAAAQKWQVPATEITTEKSMLIHAASGKRATYGEFADLAARQKPPADGALTLKSREQFKLLGQRITGVDNLDIVTGKPLFGIDQKQPGMVYASLEMCPAVGGKVKSANLDEIKTLPGVLDAFVVEGGGGATQVLPGVAVISTSTWAAFKARKSLKVEWDESAASKDSLSAWTKQAEEATAGDGETVKEAGKVDEAFASAAKTVDGYYTYPFVSHSPLEPMNCTAQYKDGKLTFWAPTQMPTNALRLVATATGVPVEKITIHQTRVGGGFGRRLMNDYMCQAGVIAKQLNGVPVKLQWTREDDMMHDFFRPGGFHRFKGAIDAQGKITAWQTHQVSFVASDRPVSGGAMNGNEMPGPFVPNFKLAQTKIELATPCGPWRAPGSNVFAFTTQSFIHELAVAAGRDHVEVLLELLGEPRQLPANAGGLHTGRAAACIKMAAEKAGWGQKLPAGRGLGLAFYYSHAGHFAEVADVTVDKDKKITLNRVVVVGDVGPIVNMSGAENQVEGCVIDGFSTMMGLQIGIENGVVQQNNFHQYPLLRIRHAPKVETHFIESDYDPTGIGEPALPPLLPAVANAIFAATGHRVRTLPLTREGYKLA